MKKPTAVKIIEVLGWMEVVLVLYGVIWAVNAIVHGKCGSALDVWICMGDGPKRMQVLKPKNIHAISLPEESLSELADTYVLTPTGRIVLVDITASPE